MTFPELEQTVQRHLLLGDRGIIKLVCAVVLANRMPALDPTWLFIVSSSSGGKSEILSALSAARGMWEQDDLTAKTFISGIKSYEKATSLLDRLPENAVMLIKDLTLLLNKDPKESSAIFDQLRLIYDGKFYKSFGTGEDVRRNPRMGLIAGVTSSIEELAMRMAALGERAIKYYMEQPDREEATMKSVRNKLKKVGREEMAKAFHEYLDEDSRLNLPPELKDLTDQEYEAIVKLSEMATSARSSIGRKQYSRGNPINMIHLKEMPMRMANQLVNIARGIMVINEGPLTPSDQSILYKIAMDSIPSQRKNIMEKLTHFSATTIKSVALTTKLDEESVIMLMNDLVALDIVTKSLGHGNRWIYTLREDYRELMSSFRGIEMTNKVDDVEAVNDTPEEVGGVIDTISAEPPVDDKPPFLI